jgi:hypothetical protein
MRRSIVLFILLMMASCQEKLDGNDFDSSRKKVEDELDERERVNLEKALRVVALEAMRLKWDLREEYKGKSLDDISLSMVDGQTYTSVVDLAEDILKATNKREIEKATREIARLDSLKGKSVNIEKRLDLFKVSSVKINRVDFFDRMVPELEVEYKYIGASPLQGPMTFQFELLQRLTGEVIKSQIITIGDETSLIGAQESFDEHLILSETQETNPRLWNASRYPMENPNLSDFNLELKVTVVSLVLDGYKVERPKLTAEEIESLIDVKEERIKELKTVRGTLDELELTTD